MKNLILLSIFILASKFSFGATFSSVSSGTWSAPATWSITGTDADGIPDSDDDVTINTGHTVTLVSSINSFKTLIVSSGGVLNANNHRLHAYGNFTINGSMIGPVSFQTYAACILSSANTITNSGDWHIRTGNLTIAAGTSINKGNFLIVYSGQQLINYGNITLSGGSINFQASNATFVNGNGGNIILNKNIGGTGVINASAATNTVTYNNSVITQIYGATYYNLVINGASTKTLTANTTVLNNFTLNTASNILNMAGYNLTIGGNWINNANSTLTNQGTVTFNTSSSQTITRSSANEVFTNMVVSGSGTSVLGSAIDVTNLTISGGNLDVSASNRNINVKTSLTNNGTINCRTGTVIFNGSGASTLSGSTNTQFYNLTLNNTSGLTVNSAQSVSNNLTVQAGNFNSNGNITLLSNASTTARIAALGAGASISGNMTIQQFISTRTKGWHDLSSPVQNSTINDWDNEMYMSGIGPNDGTPGPAGVDGNAAGFPSVYRWNEPTSAYVQVTGSSTPLVVGRGYEIWLADDQTNWYSKTIDARGVPNQGTQVFNLTNSGSGTNKGVNLLGNPFASKIDMSATTKNLISSSVLILDNSGNYTDYGANAIVPPHQGFWLTATGAGASISIPENAKSTSNTTNFYRTVPNYGIKLVFSSASSPYYNENTINFDANSTLGYDIELDAPYIKSPLNTAPAMFMLDNADNNGGLIKNTISPEPEIAMIRLGFYTPESGMYTISPNVLNSSDYKYAWLENTKTGVRYDLNNGAISVEGEAEAINKDWVLYLSKKQASSVNTQQSGNDIFIFGSENTLNIRSTAFDHVLTNVSVYDVSGKLVYAQDNVDLKAGDLKTINTSSLTKGIYMVSITDETSKVTVKKLIL